MTLGTSLFLIAAGAILKFAVHKSVSGISLDTVGVILMVVGIVGLVLSLIFMNSARRRGAIVEREAVVERDPYVP